jgi:hypothetical protein
LELFALFIAKLKEMISAKSVPTRNGLDVGRDRNTGITRAIYKLRVGTDFAEIISFNFHLAIPNPAHQSQKIALLELSTNP